MSRHYSSTTVCTRYLRVSLLVVLVLIALPGIVSAQGGDNPEIEAQRHIELAQAYEDAGLWEEAEAEYRAVLSLSDSTHVPAAQAGLARVLRARTSFWVGLVVEIRRFLLWLISGASKVLIVGGMAYLVLKVVSPRLMRSTDWVVLPFSGNSDGDQGALIAELVVASLHRARLTHLRANRTALVMPEQVEIPTLSSQQYEKRLLASLTSLDSLAVEGVGLPVGTILQSLLQWLSGGRNEVVGSIWWGLREVRLSARLEEGRQQRCAHVWEVTVPLDRGEEAPDAIFDLSQRLAFCILFNTQDGWKTTSGEALRFFTRGLATLQECDVGAYDESLLEEALNCFSQALTLDPLYREAQYNLALTYIHLSRYREAIELLKILRQQISNILMANVTYNLGVAYYHMARDWAYDYAEEAFKSVASVLKPTTRSSTEKELLALAYCGLTGIAAQRVRQDASSARQHCAEALYYFKTAIATAGDRSDVRAIAKTMLGLAHFHCGQYAKAVEFFRGATEDKEDHWRAYTHWGRAEMAQDNLDEARVCLKQAVALNPRFQLAQFSLGLVHKRLRQMDEAMQAFRQASAIAPAHNEIGEILAGRGELESALEEFRCAVTINSKFAQAWANLAWYALEAGQTDEEGLKEATRWAKKAVACARGTDLEWHERAVLGRVYVERGMLDDAEHEFAHALELKPSNAQSHYYRAEIAWRRGELERARSLLIDFFKLEHGGVWHDKAVLLMRQVQGAL